MHAMSTLQPQRTKTGLLIIDVQIGVMAAAYHRSEVISTIAALLTSARRSGAPVVWVQHSDDQLAINSPGWQYVPELVRLEGEPLVHKRYEIGRAHV